MSEKGFSASFLFSFSFLLAVCATTPAYAGSENWLLLLRIGFLVSWSSGFWFEFWTVHCSSSSILLHVLSSSPQHYHRHFIFFPPFLIIFTVMGILPFDPWIGVWSHHLFTKDLFIITSLKMERSLVKFIRYWIGCDRNGHRVSKNDGSSHICFWWLKMAIVSYEKYDTL